MLLQFSTTKWLGFTALSFLTGNRTCINYKTIIMAIPRMQSSEH